MSATAQLIAALHDHERFMREALKEAALALAAGDMPVGAVIVHAGEIVARGRNKTESTRNDLHHAEHAAVASIPQFLWEHRRRCIVYTTLEPCAMCLGSMVYSAIDRVYWGASDPLCGTAATVACTPYYNRRRLVLQGGVLEDACQALFDEYHRRNPIRPYLVKAN